MEVDSLKKELYKCDMLIKAYEDIPLSIYYRFVRKNEKANRPLQLYFSSRRSRMF